MAATRASKLVQCTSYDNGGTFYVSANKIIKFTTVLGVADTLLTYINQFDNQVTVRITQSVGTIASAMDSSTISLAIALTVETMNGMTLPSSVIYVNKERIVFLDTNPTTGANTDVTIDTGKADYEVWTISSPAIGSVASENMFPVTIESNDLVRYINNLFIDSVTGDTSPSSNASSAAISAAGTGYAPTNTITIAGGTYTNQAVFNVATTKLVSAAVNAAGSGYAPADTVTLAGGTFSTAAVLTVATTKLVGANLNAAGTGYATADTITLAGGTFSTAGVLTVATTKLVSAAVNSGGAGYNVGDTITLAGGTFTTAAVLTVATEAGGVIQTFTISTPGAYTVNSAALTQSATSGGGTGATFNLGLFGVATFTISTAGSYTVNTAAFTQGATSGAGTGATFNTAVYGINTFTISTAGSYTVNTVTFTQGATSGGGTAATFNTGLYGVNTLTVNNAGQYSVVPTNPAAQYSTSGSGTGATLTVTWGDGAQILYDNKRTGFIKLQVVESASALATTVNAL